MQIDNISGFLNTTLQYKQDYHQEWIISQTANIILILVTIMCIGSALKFLIEKNGLNKKAICTNFDELIVYKVIVLSGLLCLCRLGMTALVTNLHLVSTENCALACGVVLISRDIRASRQSFIRIPLAEDEILLFQNMHLVWRKVVSLCDLYLGWFSLPNQRLYRNSIPLHISCRVQMHRPPLHAQRP